jgi:hypothetical protein
MKIRSCKNKGRRLVKEIQSLLIQKYGLSENDFCVPPGSVPGTDIKLSKAAAAKFNYGVECKNQESLNIWSSLSQCEKNAGELTPLLVFKRNRSKTYCVLELGDFLKIIK